MKESKLKINDSITVEINKKFEEAIIRLNILGEEKPFVTLSLYDYYHTDIAYDENYIVIYSTEVIVNKKTSIVKYAYNIKTDTILDVRNDEKLSSDLEFMVISKKYFDCITVISIINPLIYSHTLDFDENEINYMINYLTNGNKSITKKQIVDYILSIYPELSKYKKMTNRILEIDYKTFIKEFGGWGLYFHKMPQIIDPSINELKEVKEPMHRSISVLAVSCDKPFVVASENVEEFKNTKANPEVLEQTEEMAKEFKTNNLGPVLKKTKKPNK